MIWVIDKILEILDTRTKIEVLVHLAFLSGDSEPKYFIKVTNISAKNISTITHVWVKDGDQEKEIINFQRPLPKRLNTSDQWETWFNKSLIKDHINIFENVRVVLSNKKIIKSKKNLAVRPSGFVA